MLSGLLSFLYVFCCLVLILLILIQKGKGAMGLGGMGGGAQMLFGGSGGQDIFQKTTWVLGALIIFGSLGISLVKVRAYKSSHYLKHYQAPIAPINK